MKRTTLTCRLATKVDMSPPAVTSRLRSQAVLRDACLAWGRAAAGPGPPRRRLDGRMPRTIHSGRTPWRDGC